jgi:hypothetical protein
MKNERKKALILAAAAGLAALLSACYSSAGPGRDASDVSPDRPPDVVPDSPPDVVPDFTPDPIVDVVQDEILPPPDIVDIVPDFPPDVSPDLPPFEGATFVVTNTTDGFMYLSVWQYGEDPADLEYDLFLIHDSSDPRETFYLWQPWCTVDCSTVTDPTSCCMDCIPPFVNTLIRLMPGESIRVSWSGTVFSMDDEVCECGCYRHFPVPYGEYRASICGSPYYVCFSGVDCHVDENGFIQQAGLSDVVQCTNVSFPVPEASGWVIEMFF